MVYVKPPYMFRWFQDLEDSIPVDHYHVVHPRKFTELKHYWMIDQHALEKSKLDVQTCSIHLQTSANNSRSRYLSGRDHRNLLNYEGCDDEELRRFVHDRKLTMDEIDTKYFGATRNAGMSAPTIICSCRCAMIDALENEDEYGTTFGRLLDLPAELRVLVYCDYFESLPIRELRGICAPPPLAEVCRQLRAEVLPQFYGKTTFKLRLNEWLDGRLKVVLDSDEHLLASGPRTYLAHINKLLVEVKFWSACPSRIFQTDLEWWVDLPTSTRPGRVVPGCRRREEPSWATPTSAGVQAALRARLNAIGSGPEGTYPSEARSSALEQFLRRLRTGQNWERKKT